MTLYDTNPNFNSKQGKNREVILLQTLSVESSQIETPVILYRKLASVKWEEDDLKDVDRVRTRRLLIGCFLVFSLVCVLSCVAAVVLLF